MGWKNFPNLDRTLTFAIVMMKINMGIIIDFDADDCLKDNLANLDLEHSYPPSSSYTIYQTKT